MVGLGAYPFATPHTRPSRVSCTTPSHEMARRVRWLKNSVDVPAGAEAVLEHALHGRERTVNDLVAQTGLGQAVTSNRSAGGGGDHVASAAAAGGQDGGDAGGGQHAVGADRRGVRADPR